jgi:hypothetical protein
VVFGLHPHPVEAVARGYPQLAKPTATKRTTGRSLPFVFINLFLNAGLGLIVPLHARLFLAFGLRGGGLDGLSKHWRRNGGSNGQGYDGCEALHWDIPPIFTWLSE